jgi:crossover junction endodeoxyribonuclease RusA
MPVLHLVLPMPPSANAYWRAAPGKGLVPSRRALAYKAVVAMECQRLGVQPLLGDVRLVGTVYRARATGDLDNTLKVLLDALEGHAFLDDAQVSAIALSRSPGTHRGQARVELELHGAAFASDTQVRAFQEKRAQASGRRRISRNAKSTRRLVNMSICGRVARRPTPNLRSPR